MGNVWTVAGLTFLKLRRDRVHLGAIIGGLGLIFFAALASQWALEDILKMFFDFATFACHLVGVAVALFWGTKMVADARRDGSLEIHMAAPIGRSSWIVGNFLGLACALLWMGVILVVFWQLAMIFLGFGLMTPHQLMVFPLLILGWMVVGALAIFFASITSASIAIFCGSCLWIAGLISFPISRALGAETPALTRQVVEGIAMVWNLKQFQVGDLVFEAGGITVREWANHCAYGVALTVFLVSLACFFFRTRDVTS